MFEGNHKYDLIQTLGQCLATIQLENMPLSSRGHEVFQITNEKFMPCVQSYEYKGLKASNRTPQKVQMELSPQKITTPDLSFPKKESLHVTPQKVQGPY